MGNIRSKPNTIYKELSEKLHKQELDIAIVDNIDHSVYNNEGILIYRGGYKNKNLNGWGKMYNSKGDIRYEGNFKDGKPDGEGSLYLYKIKYKGDFKNGKLEGHGHVIYEEDDPNCKTEFDCNFNKGVIVKDDLK